MTDDRLNKLKEQAEDRAKSLQAYLVNPRDILNIIQMVDEARSEIDSLHERLDAAEHRRDELHREFNHERGLRIGLEVELERLKKEST